MTYEQLKLWDDQILEGEQREACCNNPTTCDCDFDCQLCEQECPCVSILEPGDPSVVGTEFPEDVFSNGFTSYGSVDELVADFSDDPFIKRREGSARFHALLEKIGALHDKKQRDYGSATDPFANVRASQEFGVKPWVGALVRLNDKVTRLKAFATKGELANESAEDSMLDIAVYALIALILYQEESE
jgi:hypothetical protein